MKATHSLKHGDIFLTPKSRKAVPDLPLTRGHPSHNLTPSLFYLLYSYTCRKTQIQPN